MRKCYRPISEEERRKDEEAMELRATNRNIFPKLKEGIEYTHHGNSSFSNNQIISTAYAIMTQTNVFKKVHREWRRMALTKKYCLTSKLSFSSMCRLEARN